MIVATNLAFCFLAVGALLSVVRLVRGPSIADRVVASDLFLTFLVMAAATLSARSGQGVYLEAMLVVAVVGFLGTAMVARFIERRGA
jgi:multisubunit Na+/H+ antiporter MnhF subunit